MRAGVVERIECPVHVEERDRLAVGLDADGAAWRNLSHRRNPDEIRHHFVLPSPLRSTPRTGPALARAKTIEYERFIPASTNPASSDDADGNPEREQTMSLRVLEGPDDIADALREAILAAIPDASIDVVPGSPGHFEIRVISKTFAGQSMVQQQQRVYAAIKELMAGDTAPVHAIDRLRTSVD
jgi:stress-induced morphogen